MNWNLGAVKMNVDPPPIPVIKSKKYDKPDNDCVKSKLSRDPTSEKSDLYEFKMTLFDNVKPEEFLLFVRYFQMTLEASGMLAAGANIQYLLMVVRGEALHQLDTLSDEVRINTSENFKPHYFGFRHVCFPC